MKKILSSIISLSLVFSLGIPVFAAETNTHELIYQNNASYEISIPASSNIDIATGKGEINVGVTEAKLEKWTGVSITISSSNYSDGSWNLVNTKDGNDKITYSIGTADGANDIASGDEVAFAKDAGTTTLYVNVSDTSKVGTFTDTITFTSEITTKVIEFSIWMEDTREETFYEAIDGMTWEDWINSEYNTAGLYVNSGFVCGGLEGMLEIDDYTELMKADTLILNGQGYYVGLVRM